MNVMCNSNVELIASANTNAIILFDGNGFELSLNVLYAIYMQNHVILEEEYMRCIVRNCLRLAM